MLRGRTTCGCCESFLYMEVVPHFISPCRKKCGRHETLPPSAQHGLARGSRVPQNRPDRFASAWVGGRPQRR